MLMSMTGFSSTTINIARNNAEPLHITLTLKSLNARFLEVTCKLPSSLTHLETEFLKLLKKFVIRGTVYATVQITNSNALKTEVLPAFDLVESYLASLGQIQKKFNIAGQLAMSDLLRLPNIFELPDTIIDEKISNSIVKAFEQLIVELIKEREREGVALKADIMQRLVILRNLLSSITQRSTHALEDRKAQLLASFGPLLSSESKETREQNVHAFGMQLARYDINEEIVRFANHLDNLDATINDSDTQKGKKIDFITQELFREINTIASKANDAQLTNDAISVKVELEKIREQGQNIL